MAAENKSSFEISGNSESGSIEATIGRALASDHSSTHTVQNSPNEYSDTYNFQLPHHHSPAMDLLMSVSISADTYKQKIIDLAFTASEELKQLAQEQDPNLWLHDSTKRIDVLNDVEYKKRFAPLDGSLEEIIRVIASGGPIELPNLSNNNEVDDQNECKYSSEMMMENGAVSSLETEASRAIGVVSMSSDRLVKMFMDVDQWSSVFSNMVSQATNLGILLTGEPENPNGVLQVMIAEFHISSPLDRGREIYFARYCRQLAFDTWLVADVSLEKVFPNPVVKCQRRPSGCLIQALQDGVSKVTWVENNAVCYGSVQDMFTLLVASGFAFSANRWLATLERFCDRLSIMDSKSCQSMIQNNTHEELGAGRESLLKVARRMVRSYHANINSCTDNSWRPMPINGAEDILVRTSFNMDDPGIPRGVAVNIATSIWLPVSQDYIFDFLSDGSNRNKWDLLYQGRVTRDTMSFPTARHPGCGVSVVIVEPAPNKIVNLYLQESFVDSTGYYVVYAPIDIFALHHMMEGKNPDVVAILPSGFAILPDGSSTIHEGNTSNGNGSILTIAFEIIDEHLSTPEYLPSLSVSTAYNIINQTVSLIKSALLSNNN